MNAIREFARLDLRFEPKPWDFARERRTEIDAFFIAQQRIQPALWNGRVLLAHRYEMDGDIFRAGFLETDFASFLAWRRWGHPQAGVFDCFGSAAVLSCDGAFLLGVMAPHTSNAGQAYFPCGMPDLDDVAAATIDFTQSIARELEEETGIAMAGLALEPRWTLVQHGPHLPLFKVARSPLDAAALKARVRRFLASDENAELADIHMVRAPADLDKSVSPFVADFLRHRWGKT